MAGVILVAVLTGAAIVLSPTEAGGLAALGTIFAVTYWRPDLGLSIWLLATLFTPFWLRGQIAGIAVFPSYLALPILIAALLAGVRFRTRLGVADAAMFSGVVLVVVSHAMFHQATFLLTNVAITLLSGYVIGRMADPHSIGRTFRLSVLLIAAWGLLEFATGLHLFSAIPPLEGIGPEIQDRAGLARAEASLGHAIAYGATLTAALPWVLQRRRALLGVTTLCAGVVVSLSRGPMLSLVLTLMLFAYVRRSQTGRVKALLTLTVAGFVAYVVLTFLYSGSGEAELNSSSAARNSQVGILAQLANWFGPADGLHLIDGRYTANGIGIVDSTPLRLALDFGWVTCVLLLLPMAIAIIGTLRRARSTAAIAVAGQLPVILVTSLITQWQTVLFFIAGLAMTELAAGDSGTQAESNRERSPADRADARDDGVSRDA